MFPFVFLLYSFLGHDSVHEKPAPNTWTIVGVQAAGGILAGATASCITTPLDTIKTRLQVYLVCIQKFLLFDWADCLIRVMELHSSLM